MRKGKRLEMSDEQITGEAASEAPHDVTGGETELDVRTVTCVLGRYVVKVLLSGDGRFLDVLEVGVNQEFMDYRQKGLSRGLEQAEAFYEEEQA